LRCRAAWESVLSNGFSIALQKNLDYLKIETLAMQKRLTLILREFWKGLFFTVAVAAKVSGVLPAMIAWLAVKLVANWQFRDDIKSHHEKAKL
jgi:hypothetical protein